LSIQDQYIGGAPITAPTWQDAVRQSLTGMVRENYGVDPIYNWDPNQSGQPGSQYRMGTFQELSNTQPRFFDTSGNLIRHMLTGEVMPAHGQNYQFDPLLGLNPQDKLLGFEDVPFEQIEKAVGGLPGQFYAPSQEYIGLGTQIEELTRQRRALPEKTSEHHSQRAALDSQIAALTAQMNQINPFMGIDQLRQSANVDFNDLLFKLNIDQYAPPAPIIRATPESVLQEFFRTPAYQLAFGNSPGVLDPYAAPTERFQFDPGYQFAQTEGLRQLQMDQSKRGLLESGRGARDIQQFSQGLADQNYQRWLGQNEGLFTDWTNRLQGLTAQGAAASGQQSQNAMNLGQLLGGADLTTAGLLASLTGQTGTNISSLFGNQGVFGASSFLNTGAAQSSNIMQAASIQAQIAAANAASQAAGAGASSGGGGSSIGGALGSIGSALGGLGGFF